MALSEAGLNTAVFDLDPQATAANWGDRREAAMPVVRSAHQRQFWPPSVRGIDDGCWPDRAGFTVNNTLPVEGAWPDGEVKTNYAGLDLKAARSWWSEACARHWWRAFLEADNPTEAYAAWVLFLRSADRRAWGWMYKDVEATAKDSDNFFTLKMAHAELNREELKRAVKKRDDKLDKNFLYRRIVSSVGPWV